MLLGALIWIATLVPYFVVYSDRKYKAMTRYQIHVYLTSDNQRPRSEGEFQASDPRSKRPCCNAGVLRKFRVIKDRNACVQVTSDRRLIGLSVSSPGYRNNQNTRRKTKEMFLSTLVKSWPFLDVECPAILSLRSLGYFLERTLVSLYDATVSDVSPSLLGTFYFCNTMKMCLSVVSLLCNVPRGGEREETAMLWFNFILGLNFIFFCFKLNIIHYHTQKQKKRKFKPRIKLNLNSYIHSPGGVGGGGGGTSL